MEPKKMSELIPLTLQSSQLTRLKTCDELSIYSDKLTAKGLVDGVALIKKSFPSLPMSFFDVFMDRIKANNFTDTRLQDAIAHVIDTCTYPAPTIAQFISFDRTVKLFSYEDMVKKVAEFGSAINKSYEMVKLPGREKPVWIHIDDIKKYNIKSL